MKKKSPTRTHLARAVSNSDLVDWCTAAANIAARRMRWPRNLPKSRAARLLHEYVQTKTRYLAEPAHRQIVRLPSALVKQRVGDCKSTAVFIGAGIRAAGAPAALRFIRQKKGRPWNHVYVVSEGIPIDPLFPFGSEAVYLEAMDIPID
jgi:hypothetical protein